MSFHGRHIDPWFVCDLHGLDYAAGWESYGLHDLAHASCVGSVLHTTCTISHKEIYRICMICLIVYDLDDLYDL